MSSVKHVSTAPDCAALLELIPEYAFGLSSPEEASFLEAHIAACPEAVAQLEDFRRIQDDMREDVPQLEPSAQLEQRLFAAIRLDADTAPTPVLAAEHAAPSMVIRPVHFDPSPTPSAALPFAVVKPAESEAQARRRSLPYGWLAAVAAVVALVLTNAYWMSQVSGLNERMVRLEDEANAISSSIPEEPFVLTSNQPLNWSRMAPDEGTGIDAAAFLMWNEDSDRGLLYARNLPELEPGRTYQLWFVQRDERTNAGTFTVDEDGNAVLVFDITEPIDNYRWARITDAPDDGSDPSRRIFVHGVVNEDVAAPTEEPAPATNS